MKSGHLWKTTKKLPTSIIRCQLHFCNFSVSRSSISLHHQKRRARDRTPQGQNRLLQSSSYTANICENHTVQTNSSQGSSPEQFILKSPWNTRSNASWRLQQIWFIQCQSVLTHTAAQVSKSLNIGAAPIDLRKHCSSTRRYSCPSRMQHCRNQCWLQTPYIWCKYVHTQSAAC